MRRIYVNICQWLCEMKGYELQHVTGKEASERRMGLSALKLHTKAPVVSWAQLDSKRGMKSSRAYSKPLSQPKRTKPVRKCKSHPTA